MRCVGSSVRLTKEGGMNTCIPVKNSNRLSRMVMALKLNNNDRLGATTVDTT